MRYPASAKAATMREARAMGSPRAVSTIVLATIRSTAATLISDIPFSSSMRDGTGSTSPTSGRCRAVPLSTMIRMLVQAEQLSFEDAEALSLFNQVRNRIVHGHDADDHEVARAIDSGTRLLRLLRSRPRQRPETAGPVDGS